jgi:8-oxo-dGTP pyrophosphatase MutT (NUDIX family)
VSEFDLIGSEVVWRGKFISAGVQHFRHTDGAVVARDKVWHPGAVGMLAIDDEFVWLTRQPREAGGLTASLEIPAGKLDLPGEDPLAAAKRELAEEIGLQAGSWEPLKSFFTSLGFCDERIHLYVARDLSAADGEAEADEDERIEVVPWPLDRIDDAIAESEDSKTLIALGWLARALERGRPGAG